MRHMMFNNVIFICFYCKHHMCMYSDWFLVNGLRVASISLPWLCCKSLTLFAMIVINLQFLFGLKHECGVSAEYMWRRSNSSSEGGALCEHF